MTYSLIIFDMDGTLVQSEDCASQAMLDVMPGLTGTVSEVTSKYRGMRLADIFNDVKAITPGGVPENVLDLYRAREELLSGTMITPSVGVEQLLDQITLPMCVASNAPVEKSQRSLNNSGLLHHFEGAVFSAYQVQAWKPDPTLFEHAAKHFSMKPDQCLVVEDSVVGIQAAQAAGMPHVYYDPHNNGEAPEGVKTIAALLDLLELLD